MAATATSGALSGGRQDTNMHRPSSCYRHLQHFTHPHLCACLITSSRRPPALLHIKTPHSLQQNAPPHLCACCHPAPSHSRRPSGLNPLTQLLNDQQLAPPRSPHGLCAPRDASRRLPHRHDAPRDAAPRHDAARHAAALPRATPRHAAAAVDAARRGCGVQLSICTAPDVSRAVMLTSFDNVDDP